MSQRERHGTPRDGRPSGATPGSPGSREDVERLRAEAANLLNAADDAVARALSGDSLAFLRANGQQGGQ